MTLLTNLRTKNNVYTTLIWSWSKARWEKLVLEPMKWCWTIPWSRRDSDNCLLHHSDEMEGPWNLIFLMWGPITQVVAVYCMKRRACHICWTHVSRPLWRMQQSVQVALKIHRLTYNLDGLNIGPLGDPNINVRNILQSLHNDVVSVHLSLDLTL